jgi:hypothetical protein
MNPGRPLGSLLFGIRMWLRLLFSKPPQNVGPVDEPFNHIMEGREVFGPEVDDLVRKLAAHPNFERYRLSVIHTLWGCTPAFGGIVRPGEVRLLLEKFLREID